MPSADWSPIRTSFSKIRRHLPEFRCRWTVERGAQQLLQVFDSIDMTTEQFQFRAFTRVEQLQHLIATRQVDADLYWLAPSDSGSAWTFKRQNATLST